MTLTTVYKRPKEENAFTCDKCNTTWLESWLVADGGPLGWCPFCGEANIPNKLVNLPAAKKKPYSSEIKTELKTIHAEANYTEAELMTHKFESTPLDAHHVGGKSVEPAEYWRHGQDLNKIVYHRAIMMNSLMTLTDLVTKRNKNTINIRQGGK